MSADVVWQTAASASLQWSKSARQACPSFAGSEPILTNLDTPLATSAAAKSLTTTGSANSAVAHLIGRTSGLDAPISDIPKLSVKLVGLLASGRSRSPAGKLALGKIALGGRSWTLDRRWLVAAFAVGLVIIASRLILMG